MLVQPAYQPRIRHPTSVSAAKRFPSYAPETDQRVRPPQPTGISDLERLRQLREELKQMPPEAVLEMMEFHRGLDMFQALDLAKRTGKLLVPNVVYHKILESTASPTLSWTGTMVIYEAPDKPFGSAVSSNGLVFTVPEQFRGMINCAMVVEYPDFDFTRKDAGAYELIVDDDSNIHLIEQFPRKTCYLSSNSLSNKLAIPSEKGSFISYIEALSVHINRSQSSNISLVSRGPIISIFGPDYDAFPMDFNFDNSPQTVSSVALIL